MKPTKVTVMWVQAWNAWGIECEDQFGNWYGIEEFYRKSFSKKSDAISAARAFKVINRVQEFKIGRVQKI